MKKIRLLTPGPVMVPEEVMLEMARPMEHHRTAYYRGLVKECHDLLRDRRPHNAEYIDTLQRRIKSGISRCHRQNGARDRGERSQALPTSVV